MSTQRGSSWVSTLRPAPRPARNTKAVSATRRRTQRPMLSGASTFSSTTFAVMATCCARKVMAMSPRHSRCRDRQAYRKMHDALVATGRPIIYSLCQYGMNSVWEWGPEVGGNLWRTTGDIKDTYERMSLIGFAQAGLAKYAGPGHWNDSDMLEVGNGGMNGDEYRTHMSLWAMLTAPLLAGNDLSKMNPETLAILENRDMIAIDQDPLGIQGDRLSAVGPLEIWSKPLSDGSRAVALFNRGELETPMTLKMSEVNLEAAVKLHDVWGDKDITVLNGTYTAVVSKHGVVFLRIRNNSHSNIQ